MIEVLAVGLVVEVTEVVLGIEVVLDTGVKVHPIKVNAIKILFLLNNIKCHSYQSMNVTWYG